MFALLLRLNEDETSDGMICEFQTLCRVFDIFIPLRSLMSESFIRKLGGRR
jgi:hypothetical protein